MEEKKEDPDKLRNKSQNEAEKPKEHEKEESAGPSKRKLRDSSDEESERARKRVKCSVTDQVRDPGRKRCRTREDEDQAGRKRAKMSSHRKLDLQTERKSDEKVQQSRGQKRSRESDEDNELERQKIAKTSSFRKFPHQKEQKAAQTPSPRKCVKKRSRDSDQDEKDEEQDRLKKVKITSSQKHNEKEVKSNKNVEQDTSKSGPSRMLLRKRSRESDEEEEQRAQKIAKIASEKSDKEEKAEEKQLDTNNEPSSDHSVAGGSGQIVASSTALSQSISDYKFQKLLGLGSFGKVMLASHKSTNHLVAIKIICKARVKETSIQKEQRILQVAQESPFLCHGLTAFHNPGNTFLVMEYIQGGSLDSFMAQKGVLSITESRFIAAELICGIQFLHSRGIIHRDLKPENVLLDQDGHVKIADFGLAAENVFGSTKVKGAQGTLRYMAPEVLCNVPYGVSADWWSFGVILCRMITGQHPFEDNTLESIFRKVVISAPCYPDWLSSDSVDLLNGLLHKKPNARLGVNGSVREHAFFKDVDWEELESCKASPPFLMSSLLHKKPNSRLGVNGSVREHAFFKDVDWEELESCKASPPLLMSSL